MYFDTEWHSVTYIFFPIIVLLYYWKSHNNSFSILFITLLIKIIFSFILLYFIVNRWDFGDLPTYYNLAHKLKSSDFKFLAGSLLIAQLHSVIFYIFGTSLYGLTLVMACVSHLAFTLMAGKIYDLTELREKNNALLWINILPFLSMQSTYIGREPWVLLFTAILFYHLNTKILSKIFFILLFLFIFLARPYHGAILGCSLAITLLFYYGLLNLRILIMTVLSLPIIFYTVSKLAFYIDLIKLVGISEFLGESYRGGNQVFEPYPFPLTFFQLFRPMPWDSSEPFMLLSSIENIFILFLLVKLILYLIKYNPLYLRNYGINLLFMFLFTIIYGSLFMFSENLGDLSRRHVYYYPFIIFAYFKLYSPLFKIKFGKMIII